MYGVVTRNAPELEWSEFDRAFFEAKDVSGRAADPEPNAVNMVSCFADNAAARGTPDLVPVDDEGNRATREQPYFDWSYICPTHPDYREGLLETIADCAAVSPDVRLDDVGFPRPEYCRCERCERRFAESEYEDRFDWRASVIESFVADARERVPGRLYLTLYPNPYPGHLRERTGVDPASLGQYVDEYVVPIYDMAYSTTYWLEILAQGFVDELVTPFSIELYAVDVDPDALGKATEVAGAYAKDVLFGYDASNARATLRRFEADAREGRRFEPE
ncbi:hypothetical protein [Halomarina oriensis]|uniref:Glycoside hydrolase domain protein n=1 Tax=Halomarina oriensis TaxID=671145 RepID=A0A6B0GJ67_9EURY|nr:hypothetical protein [Halomarina oriensis]MWG33907.1 hypothetical protein [Halomarina oriensis]